MKKVLFIIAGLLIGGAVLAAPLTAARNTVAANGNQIYLDVYTNTVIYGGGMLAVNSSGYAVEAANASGYVVVGRAEYTVDNTLGATAAKHVQGRSGVFYWDGDASSLTKAAIGQIVYVVDDHTVSVTNPGSYSTIAGIVMDYDSVRNQVAVDTHDFAASAASTVGSLTVSGAATVGTSLGVGTSETVGTTLGVTGKITGGAGLGLTGNAVISGATTTATENCTGNMVVGGTLNVTGATVLAAPAGVGTYTNAQATFTNIFDVGGRLLSHNP